MKQENKESLNYNAEQITVLLHKAMTNVINDSYSTAILTIWFEVCEELDAADIYPYDEFGMCQAEYEEAAVKLWNRKLNQIQIEVVDV